MKFSILKSNLVLSFIQIVKISHCSFAEKIESQADGTSLLAGNNQADPSSNESEKTAQFLSSIAQMLNEKTAIGELENLLNEEPNALEKLIGDHFKEAPANSSGSDESKHPKSEESFKETSAGSSKSDEPSILCSMIKKFYHEKYLRSIFFNSISDNENALKIIAIESLAEEDSSRNFQTIVSVIQGFYNHLIKNSNIKNEILRKLFSLFADKLNKCINNSEGLSYFSKKQIAMKSIEILKLFASEN